MKEKQLSKSNRFISSDCFCNSLKEFEHIQTLNPEETKVALRTLKSLLDEEFGYNMTDNLFEDIFCAIPYLRPLHPLGSGCTMLGYVEPLRRALRKHHISEGYHERILHFFRAPHPQRWKPKYLLLHIPHSSIVFPEDCQLQFDDLDVEERLLIDYYTDELFVPEKKENCIESAIFPYCRLYCDVERLVNDPLEAKGLGISYHRWTGHLNFDYRSFSTRNSAFALYADFHADVAKKLVYMGEGTLMIDCHSFSNQPNLLNSNPPDIDICIGYNDDDTCPDKVFVGNIVQYFQSRGYKVGINEPFSNSKTFAVPVEYDSVMIEVNKRLYMNEQTLEKTEGFAKLRNDIQWLYASILTN